MEQKKTPFIVLNIFLIIGTLGIVLAPFEYDVIATHPLGKADVLMYRLKAYQKRYYPPFPIQPSYPLMYRPLPEVNPKQFRNSAQHALLMLSDADIILKKISQSEDFSRKLMNAAQGSKPQIVEQLIKSLGTINVPQINYNPEGITLNFDHKSLAPHCCFISLQLRWM